MEATGTGKGNWKHISAILCKYIRIQNSWVEKQWNCHFQCQFDNKNIFFHFRFADDLNTVYEFIIFVMVLWTISSICVSLLVLMELLVEYMQHTFFTYSHFLTFMWVFFSVRGQSQFSRFNNFITFHCLVVWIGFLLLSTRWTRLAQIGGLIRLPIHFLYYSKQYYYLFYCIIFWRWIDYPSI